MSAGNGGVDVDEPHVGHGSKGFEDTLPYVLVGPAVVAPPLTESPVSHCETRDFSFPVAFAAIARCSFSSLLCPHKSLFELARQFSS